MVNLCSLFHISRHELNPIREHEMPPLDRLRKKKKKKTNRDVLSTVPDMQGVRIPSPSTIEVPSMVMIKMKYFNIRLFSSRDLTKDAILSRRIGTSSPLLDTCSCWSSGCWLGVKLTLA
jgi:hypothetical protein